MTLLGSREDAKSITPPGSVVRLVRGDHGWNSDLTVGAEPIGYYSRQDGPDCVWLVTGMLIISERGIKNPFSTLSSRCAER